MKSDRRHELKTNSLATHMQNLPEFFRVHGNKVLLGLILILLVIFLVRYRAMQAESARLEASNNLTSARQAMHNLWVGAAFARTPEEIAFNRNRAANEADQMITRAQSTEDPQLRADAYLARGDLNWELATYPPLVGSATQPDKFNLPKSPSEYLAAASDAYSQILLPPLSENHADVTSARLGLAAIAENKAEWSTAEKYYNAVISDTSSEGVMKDYARQRLDELAFLQKPVYMASAPAQSPSPPTDTLGSPLGPPAPDLSGDQSIGNSLSPSNFSLSGNGSASQPASLAPATAPSTTQPSK